MKQPMIKSSIADHVVGAVLVALAWLAFGLLLTGCSVTKVTYEKNDKGEVSYSLYRNDHWLKTESTGLRGGMTDAGKFEFSADGIKASPSEEFNRTMQTYTGAFVQLAQIAAAAYNPSSSGVITTKADTSTTTAAATTAAATTSTATAATATTNAADCVDCKEPAK